MAGLEPQSDRSRRVTEFSKPGDRSEARWWKLYRQERKKFGPFKQQLKDSEIVRAAREATRRFKEESRA